MPDDKKKQAMSLLFGDVPARPNPSDASAPEADEAPDQAPGPAPQPASRPPARTNAASAPNPVSTSRQPRKGRGEGTRATAAATPDPYYQGASRYARQAGEQVKHSVYLDPDVSRALKVAAAMGDDARGVNVSAIVNAALRELGYGPPGM